MPERSRRGPREYLLLMLKGMAMGAADVVPGVSGGTVAFVTGIYEELIDSLRRCDWTALQLLFGKGPLATWRHINGTFLVALFAGILISIGSFAQVITYFLAVYPILVWSFFFGLICASVVFIARQLEVWRWHEALALAAGTLIAFAITQLKPAQLPSDWWMVLIAGSIAICAMILPGISGSFILLLLGLYSTILKAVVELNLALLASFGLGCVLGLLSFSHLLSWLLRHYHGITLAFLTGFLVGSLNTIWPWKLTIESVLDRHGELVPLVQENVLPARYGELVGEPHVLGAVLALVLGVGLVLGLEWIAKRKPKAGI